jgi:hypothetical protein
VEYVEERPLLLSNPGMASKLINLWRLSPEDLKEEGAARSDNVGLSGSASAGKKAGPAARISRETLAINSKRVDLELTHASVSAAVAP